MNDDSSISHFDGDPEKARQRLKDIVSIACSTLDADKLNVISFTIGVHIAAATGERDLAERISADLDAERSRRRFQVISKHRKQRPRK